MLGTLLKLLFPLAFGVVLYFVVDRAVDVLIRWICNRKTSTKKKSTNTVKYSESAGSAPSTRTSSPPTRSVSPYEKESTPVKTFGVESVAQAVKEKGKGR